MALLHLIGTQLSGINIFDSLLENHCTIKAQSSRVCCSQREHTLYLCLFDLILYVPVNNVSVMSGQVFLG